MSIRFDISPEESRIIGKIVDRAESMAIEHGREFDKMSATMDVTACHRNGCELRLSDLLAAPDFDFAHDFFGITRHIDRRTGELMDCFLPRTAV